MDLKMRPGSEFLKIFISAFQFICFDFPEGMPDSLKKILSYPQNDRDLRYQ